MSINRLFNPCAPYRQEISLLANNVLPEREKGRIEQHLAVCVDCSKYFTEIKSITATMALAQAKLAPLQPTPAARARWAAAIHAAGNPEPSRKIAPAMTLRAWYLEVIHPYRSAWTTLAAVWVLIFAGHLSLQDHPQTAIAKASRGQQQMVTALRDRQSILAELLADHFTIPDADRPRPFSPRPRTEHKDILAA